MRRQATGMLIAALASLTWLPGFVPSGARVAALEIRFAEVSSTAPVDGEVYLLVNTNSSRCLASADKFSIVQGPWAALVGPHSWPTAFWKTVAVNDGYFKLVNQSSGDLLSVGGGSLEEGARLVEWKGQRYRVTFAMAASPQCAWGGGGGVKSLAVSAAGRRQRFSVDATGKTFKNMGWQRKSWEFEAVAKETTLEFYTLETTDPYCGPALDDVRVVAVTPAMR
jgi:hypothetical protein